MASLANAITLSANSRSIMLGTQIHGRILKLGFSNHIFMLNNLIKMYSRCGVFSDGLNVFDGMPERNLVSWTLIVFGVVKVCTYMRAYMLGLCVHSFSLKVGMEKNSFMGSSILHMYAKFGFIEVAEMVSEGMDSHEVGCWNAMVGEYAQCGLGLSAMSTVYLMHRRGIFMELQQIYLLIT
ncbi:hypothetical protein RHMOL_Rhmol12G0100300 [Rhododendron molle]|uniref:Uncharacterized protein n=1 Tax=Rhododendron molle TaxID=49168 RepID=A0ACC0LGS1_RHOML|nr:hypothetical protein RHMOL_Rhmol12G0100300 [Rhododendron molle]